MSFLFYLASFIVLITGLAWLASLIGIAQAYVLGGALVLFGIAVASAIARARAEPPAA
jgi:hypothetical protein